MSSGAPGWTSTYPAQVAAIADLLAEGPTVSFEFFPPRSDAAALTLGRTIAELEPLRPAFVSVTYGAGGSTRDRTRDVVTWVRRETAIPPMGHLTCVGHTRAEVVALLEEYKAAGVENILALGGDPPTDGHDAPSEFHHAAELVELIGEVGGFSVGVAAHPEVHPRSPDRATDRRYLADKLQMADFAITQFFFEAHHYLDLVDDMARLGCDKPVLPGLMPVTSAGQVRRMAELSGSELPAWLVERIDAAGGPAGVREVGVEVCTELGAQLIEAGAPGLHLYTLNQSSATREIHARLGLAAPVV